MRWLIGKTVFDTMSGWIQYWIGLDPETLSHILDTALVIIAYLLLRLAQADQETVESPLAFARLVRANLMHRKRIDHLLTPEPRPPAKSNQMSLLGI